jgi:hypothetical protein
VEAADHLEDFQDHYYCKRKENKLMPYAPGINYDFSPLFAGIQRLGTGVADAIQRYNDIHDQADANDQLMAFLANTPDPTDPEGKRTYMPKDAYSRYLALSQRQRAFGGGQLIGAMKMLEHARDAQSEIELRRAEKMHYQAQSLAALQPPAAPSVQTIPTATGPVQVLVGPGNQAQVLKQPIGGPQHEPIYSADRQRVWNDAAGRWDPVQPFAFFMGGGLPGAGAAPGGGQSTFNVAPQAGAAAPTPAPTPGVSLQTPGTQPAFSTGTMQDVQAQKQAIDQQFMSGQITRDQARQAYLQLGLFQQ